MLNDSSKQSLINSSIDSYKNNNNNKSYLILFLLLVILIILLIVINISTINSTRQIQIDSKNSFYPLTTTTTTTTTLNRHSSFFNVLKSSKSVVITTPFLSSKDDFLLVTVKTTISNHNTKVKLILATWYNLIKSNVYFITDTKDVALLDELPQDHLVVTQCEKSHSREGLSCKLAAEFQVFMEHPTKYY
jgi:hypothetical protein